MSYGIVTGKDNKMPEHVKGEYLVKYDPDTNKTSKTRIGRFLPGLSMYVNAALRGISTIYTPRSMKAGGVASNLLGIETKPVAPGIGLDTIVKDIAQGNSRKKKADTG